MTNNVDPDETACYVRVVSSGSTLFAKVSVLTCSAEKVAIYAQVPFLYHIFFFSTAGVSHVAATKRVPYSIIV